METKIAWRESLYKTEYPACCAGETVCSTVERLNSWFLFFDLLPETDYTIEDFRVSTDFKWWETTDIRTHSADFYHYSGSW